MKLGDVDDRRAQAAFEQIRIDNKVSVAAAPAAVEEADTRIAQGPLDAHLIAATRSDRRDLELLSLDPTGSRDLDQSLRLERQGSGYLFHYAIADVASWVEPGGAIDTDTRTRGQTIYCPDVRAPLHPSVLSEGAASQLQNQDVPVVLWRITLDQRGDTTDIAVERATARNHRMMSYTDAQALLEAGSDDPQLRLLEEVGALRVSLEAARGGVSLNLPSQTVDSADGTTELKYEAPAPIEGWNAQLSLCCGMAAATLMLDAGVGILRTMPAPDPRLIAELRVRSAALRVPWPDQLSYGGWVRSLDPATSAGAALLGAAARTLRGATYTSFDGSAPDPATHGAIAAPYAHVTAPLRRLVDRFATECALAAATGVRPPGWALDALALLPEIMGTTGRRASAVDHACIDVMEALVMEGSIGHTFTGLLVAVGKDGRATVQLRDPAVIAQVTIRPDHQPGDEVTVRVDAVDVEGRTVVMSIVGD